MNREQMQRRYDELCAKDDASEDGLSPEENQECTDLFYAVSGERRVDLRGAKIVEVAVDNEDMSIKKYTL